MPVWGCLKDAQFCIDSFESTSSKPAFQFPVAYADVPFSGLVCAAFYAFFPDKLSKVELISVADQSKTG